MQFILTQEEFNNLAPKSELTMQSHALAAAREKLLSLSGFNCIYSKEGSARIMNYCTGCPCDPLVHDDSKDRDLWRRICWLTKSYPQ